MARTLDLEPPAQQLVTLVNGVADDQLANPTPCQEYTVGDLLDHLVGLTLEFQRAATKSNSPTTGEADRGQPSAKNLAPDWRTRLPQQLAELAAAWRNPAAWDGVTTAGNVTMPADVMGMVAVDELVLHGWDLARATGQPFSCDDASTQATFEFTSLAAEPGQDREGLFGPVVDVPADASLLDRALGLSGRDPAWTLPA